MRRNASEYQTPLSQVPGSDHEPTPRQVYTIGSIGQRLYTDLVSEYERNHGANTPIQNDNVLMLDVGLNLPQFPIISDMSEDEMLGIGCISYKAGKNHMPLPGARWNPEQKIIVIEVNTSFSASELAYFADFGVANTQDFLCHELGHATDPMLDRPSYSGQSGAMRSHRYLHDENEVRARVYECKAFCLMKWGERAVFEGNPFEDRPTDWDMLMRNPFMREYEDAFSPENWEVLRNRVKTYVRAHGDEMINILKEHDSPPPGGGRGGGRRGRGKGRR